MWRHPFVKIRCNGLDVVFARLGARVPGSDAHACAQSTPNSAERQGCFPVPLTFRAISVILNDIHKNEKGTREMHL